MEKLPYAKRTVRRVVGLMSGTSADGVDAALVEIRGEPDAPGTALLAFENTPYPGPVRQEIFEMFDTPVATADRLARLNFLLGEIYAERALKVIRAAGLTPEEIDCVGSHGQTIYHQPVKELLYSRESGCTMQIGEGAVIAQRLGVPCVSDFRTADIAAGGQGTPLVPLTEYLLYRRQDDGVLLQNIGGIGNITAIPPGAKPEEVTAFDTGPGNMLIDCLAFHYSGGRLTMDAGGQMAGRGRVNPKLLQMLAEDPYYRREPPKTTGREYFGSGYVQRILSYQAGMAISDEDTIATVTCLTAWSVTESCRRFVLPFCRAGEMLVGGGGSYNPVLMGFLKKEMEKLSVSVKTQEEKGFHSDAKEAVAFALLADRTMQGLFGNLPRATGAESRAVLGKISFP